MEFRVNFPPQWDACVVVYPCNILLKTDVCLSVTLRLVGLSCFLEVSAFELRILSAPQVREARLG